MSCLKKLAALLLVALWLPATLHCQLESLGLDALFACAGQPAQAEHAGKDSCPDDGCQTIEAGQVTLAKSRVNVNLLPALACICVSCFQCIAPPEPAPEIFASRQEQMLPLRRTWQFTRRAAPLPGAPSPLVA